MFYLSLFLFVFIVAASTMAEVKKEFGEFRTTHTDQIKNQSVIQRHYSSRTLFKGVFGFNWCSDLDYKITIKESEMSLFDCEIGKHLIFKIVHPAYYLNSEYDLSLAVKNNQILYRRFKTTYFFSRDGRLSHWTAPSIPSPVYIIYQNNKIHRLLLQPFGSLTMVFSKEDLVTSIGKIATYDYTQGMLTKVTLNKKTIWRYQYDDFLNMTLWRGPSSSEVMKYDSEWDRIVYLKDKDECRFRYQYQIKKDRKFIVESKKCTQGLEKETLFEMISPRLLVKSPSDQLDKEFRQGANNESNF